MIQVWTKSRLEKKRREAQALYLFQTPLLIMFKVSVRDDYLGQLHTCPLIFLSGPLFPSPPTPVTPPSRLDTCYRAVPMYINGEGALYFPSSLFFPLPFA